MALKSGRLDWNNKVKANFKQESSQTEGFYFIHYFLRAKWGRVRFIHPRDQNRTTTMENNFQNKLPDCNGQLGQLELGNCTLKTLWSEPVFLQNDKDR